MPQVNRFDRIVAILVQLQSKKIVAAKDIADRFNISLRTVYRDIRTLEQAGVPIVSEAGIGYSIMAGYRLPPVSFSREEALALMTAEKFVSKLTDVHTQKAYESALYKIKAVLNNEDKELLTTVDDRIAFLENRYLPKDRNSRLNIPEILNAITGKNVLEMIYEQDPDKEPTQRKVEPIGIFSQGEKWYLVAYCRLRKDYRHFRIDRIRQLNFTKENFKTLHPGLKEFIDNLRSNETLSEVVVRVDKEVIKYFGDQHFYNGFVSMSERGAQYEMHFLSGSLTGFAKWFMMYGEHADIVKPEELKALVKQNLKEVWARGNYEN